MKLRVLTPTHVILDEEVVHVTAEDVTGSLGIRPGHAPLVTPLASGIVVARSAGGGEKFVAVNGGVMVVNDETVVIASRVAVAGPSAERLEETVLAEFEFESEQDRTNRVAFERMRMDFMRRVLDFDRAGHHL